MSRSKSTLAAIADAGPVACGRCDQPAVFSAGDPTMLAMALCASHARAYMRGYRDAGARTNTGMASVPMFPVPRGLALYRIVAGYPKVCGPMVVRGTRGARSRRRE